MFSTSIKICAREADSVYSLSLSSPQVFLLTGASLHKTTGEEQEAMQAFVQSSSYLVYIIQ